MIDLPIVTFCFDKANNNGNSTKSEYIYKTDFTLDYLIGNNGVYESISLKEGQQVKIIKTAFTDIYFIIRISKIVSTNVKTIANTTQKKLPQPIMLSVIGCPNVAIARLTSWNGITL